MKKRRIYWLFSILIIWIGCVLSFNYFYNIEKNNKIKEVNEQQKVHARLAAKNFEQLFSKWNNVLYYLSEDSNVINLNDSGKKDLIKLTGFFQNEVKGVTRTDASGRIIFTYPLNSTALGTDISHQKHMIRLLTDQKPVVSDVFTTVQGYQAIVIHYPVFRKNQYKGSVALLLDFEKLTKNILEDIRIGKSGTAWMLSSDTIELFCIKSSHVGQKIDPSHTALKHIAGPMLAGKEETSEYNADNTRSDRKFAYYLPVKIHNTFWSLAITYTEKEITASLNDFRKRLLIILSLVFISGVFLSYYGIKVWIILRESELRKMAETSLKKAQNELIKEKTLLRTLIDNLPSGVFIKDAEYKKTMANSLHIRSVQGHLRRAGWNTNVDILGKTDAEIFSAAEAELFYRDDRRIIENGEAIINQVEPGWGPDDEKIWLLVSKVPVKAENGTILGMVGITTDITDQKRIEQQLTIEKEKAELSDRLKTSFLNNISHEIRTPLNAITGFSALLKDDDLTEERKVQYADIIIESSNQLLSIITDIINIATIEAGQMKMNAGKVEMNSILHILYQQFKNTVDHKEIELTFSAGLNDKEAVIETDSTKFLEILSNLINNAIKFTEKGAVSYGYTLEDSTLLFYVRDTGIGIESEYHQVIFERFRQVENPLSQKYGGTGLGLSISKTYVELLGGHIWLTSEPGKGSTFYFTLPYVRLS